MLTPFLQIFLYQDLPDRLASRHNIGISGDIHRFSFIIRDFSTRFFHKGAFRLHNPRVLNCVRSMHRFFLPPHRQVLMLRNQVFGYPHNP